MFLFRQTVLIILIHLSLFLNSALARSHPLPHPRPTLVTKLVHYLSLESPYYHDLVNKSAREISFFDLHNSIARASHLTTLNYTLFDDKNTIEAPLEPRPLSGGFLASIQVGSKLLDQFVYMDTGSGLFWINCDPCGHYAPDPLFHPLESTTFRKENCSLGFCAKTGAVVVECNDKGNCSYTVRYGGGKFSKGYLARDSIKFGGSEEILPHVAFGCSRATNLKVNGILGLSNNPISLVSQLQSSIFAYCIGNISDTSYPYSVLAIGDKIDLLGKQTKLIVEDKYYLTLEAIKFGGKALDIDASIFQRNPSEYTGGMIVDSGCTYTFIPQVVVDKIDAEIIALIGPRLSRNHNIMYEDGYPMLCFDGLLTRDLDRWFPIVAFKFSGNDADMEFSYENMFRQIDDKSFCSVVIPSEAVAGPTTTLSILGNMMQQYYFIRFDLSEKIFSFERMECDYLNN